MAKSTRTVENLPAIIEKDEQEKVAMTILKKSDLNKIAEIKAKIVSFEKYKGITIADENDADGYEIARKAVADMRTTRTSADNERKNMTKPYRDTVAFINDFFDVADSIKLIEQPIKDRMNEIDEIEESKKRKVKEDEEKKLNERVNELLKYMAFDGNYYILAAVPELNISQMSIGVVDVRQFSDDMFKQWLQQVIDKYAIIQTDADKKAEEKRLAEEEAEKKHQKQQEEFDRQQAEFKKQQDEFNRQKQEIELQKKELEKEKEVEAEKRRNDELTKMKEKINSRFKQLHELGMKLDSVNMAYVFSGVNIDISTEVNLWTDKEWDNKLLEIKPMIEQIKKEIANKEAEERKENEKRIAEKAIAEENRKREEEQRKKEEELAQANDKTKWSDILQKLKAISSTLPEMKSPSYKKKVSDLFNYISELS